MTYRLGELGPRIERNAGEAAPAAAPVFPDSNDLPKPNVGNPQVQAENTDDTSSPSEVTTTAATLSLDPRSIAIFFMSDPAADAVAIALHEFIDEPDVRAGLLRAEASDPSEERPGTCCIISVRKAARRALLSEGELRAAIEQTVMDDSLPDEDRLQPLTSSPDGRGMFFELSHEAVQAVFDIGLHANGPRARAWYRLNRGPASPEFVPTLLDDLANHPDDRVRAAAASALKRYLDDPAVRADLERALADDPSQNVVRTAGDVLQSSSS